MKIEDVARDFKTWSCKIGGRWLAGGAVAPMINAIDKAFKELTGYDAEFCFSG